MAIGFALPQVTESEEFPLIPEGLYICRLKTMENMGPGMSFNGEEPKDRIRWVFEIEEVISGDDESEDFVGQDLHAWSSWSMNVKANMYKWSCALLGREIEKHENIRTEDLIGKRARVNIEHYEKKNGETGHRPASMLRVATKKKRAPAPVVEAEDDDPDLF